MPFWKKQGDLEKPLLDLSARNFPAESPHSRRHCRAGGLNKKSFKRSFLSPQLQVKGLPAPLPFCPARHPRRTVLPSPPW